MSCDLLRVLVSDGGACCSTKSIHFQVGGMTWLYNIFFVFCCCFFVNFFVFVLMFMAKQVISHSVIAEERRVVMCTLKNQNQA